MKTNKNPYLKTQIEIMKVLLDGSKKPQNQIAKETNYEKSTISHALDNLEKRKVILRERKNLESGYTNKGNYSNKLCWISFELDDRKPILDFLREMVQNDKSIIPFLQKRWEIIHLIYSIFPDIHRAYSFEVFKRKMTLSRKYFEVYLICDPNAPPQDESEYDNFIKNIRKTILISISVLNSDGVEYDYFREIEEYGVDHLFNACILYDFLSFNSPDPHADLMRVLGEYLPID